MMLGVRRRWPPLVLGRPTELCGRKTAGVVASRVSTTLRVKRNTRIKLGFAWK